MKSAWPCLRIFSTIVLIAAQLTMCDESSATAGPNLVNNPPPVESKRVERLKRRLSRQYRQLVGRIFSKTEDPTKASRPFQAAPAAPQRTFFGKGASDGQSLIAPPSSLRARPSQASPMGGNVETLSGPELDKQGTPLPTDTHENNSVVSNIESPHSDPTLRPSDRSLAGGKEKLEAPSGDQSQPRQQGLSAESAKPAPAIHLIKSPYSVSHQKVNLNFKKSVARSQSQTSGNFRTPQRPPPTLAQKIGHVATLIIDHLTPMAVKLPSVNIFHALNPTSGIKAIKSVLADSHPAFTNLAPKFTRGKDALSTISEHRQRGYEIIAGVSEAHDRATQGLQETEFRPEAAAPPSKDDALFLNSLKLGHRLGQNFLAEESAGLGMDDKDQKTHFAALGQLLSERRPEENKAEKILKFVAKDEPTVRELGQQAQRSDIPRRQGGQGEPAFGEQGKGQALRNLMLLRPRMRDQALGQQRHSFAPKDQGPANFTPPSFNRQQHFSSINSNPGARPGLANGGIQGNFGHRMAQADVVSGAQRILVNRATERAPYPLRAANQGGQPLPSTPK